jgi:reactive intermediate/imine deaminase
MYKSRINYLPALLFIVAAFFISSCSGPEAEAPVFIPQEGGTAPYSKAVKAGDFIYLSGMLGTSADGSLDPDFNNQSKQVMENIRARLGELGLEMKDVVKATVMIRDMAKWSDFNVIYKSYFEEGRYPARSAFGAAALALGAEIEVEVIAYKAR